MGRSRRRKWKERLVNELKANAQRRIAHSGGMRPAGLSMPESVLMLLTRAARRRGISKMSYMRRAVAAFIAHDLELDWKLVVKEFPAARPFEGKATAGVDAFDSGEGYGDWRLPPR